MIEEQAIEICKKKIIEPFYDFPNPTSIELKDTDVEAIETVLSMLKEKDKEAQQYFKTTIMQAEKFDKELEQKNKQIDLMAYFIFQNIDVEEDICNSAYVECKQEMTQDITCINCIKQYFERKCEE